MAKNQLLQYFTQQGHLVMSSCPQMKPENVISSKHRVARGGISATKILKFEFPAKIFNFQAFPVWQCFRNH